MRPGGTVTVSGSGFRPGKVALTLGSATATAAVNGAGRFTARVRVPWQTVPGLVAVTATQSARRAATQVRVGVDWSIPGFNRAHSFVNPYEKQLIRTNIAGLAVAGRYALPEKGADNRFGWFSTIGDSAYACSLLGDVVKFDLATRAPIWQYDANEEHVQRCSGEGGPFVDAKGNVWIGQIRLDSKTGTEERWGIYADATLSYGGLIVAMATHKVGNGPFAVDPETGEIVWMSMSGIYGSFITSTGILYHWDPDTLFATDPKTGQDLWSRPYADGSLGNISSNGKQLIAFKSIADNAGGRTVLTALEPDTGLLTWTVDVSNGYSSFVTVDADRAYLIRSLTPRGDQNLVGIGLDGTQKWATPLPKADVLYDTRITQANGILYVPLYGALNTYDAATGARLDSLPLRDPNGAKVVPGTAIVDDGHVYVTSTTGVYDLALAAP